MSDEFTGQELEHFRQALRKVLGQADEAAGHVEGEYLNRGSGGLDTQGDAGADREFEEVPYASLCVSCREQAEEETA